MYRKIKNDELKTRVFLARSMREIFVGKQTPLCCLETQPTDHAFVKV
jgi:hypothetical protein